MLNVTMTGEFEQGRSSPGRTAHGRDNDIGVPYQSHEITLYVMLFSKTSRPNQPWRRHLAASDQEALGPVETVQERLSDRRERRQDKQWGLVDCISFVVMREMNLTEALSFDQHFAQAGFKLLA
jgi:predicted nucleic acid-binding protein